MTCHARAGLRVDMNQAAGALKVKQSEPEGSTTGRRVNARPPLLEAASEHSLHPTTSCGRAGSEDEGFETRDPLHATARVVRIGPSSTGASYGRRGIDRISLTHRPGEGPPGRGHRARRGRGRQHTDLALRLRGSGVGAELGLRWGLAGAWSAGQPLAHNRVLTTRTKASLTWRRELVLGARRSGRRGTGSGRGRRWLQGIWGGGSDIRVDRREGRRASRFNPPAPGLPTSVL